LDLSLNGIGDAGAKFLSEGIKEARVPLTLYLRDNDIGEAGAKFISAGIKEARVPLTLNLKNNDIGEAGAEFLSEGIKEARFPLTLYLKNNDIGEAGAKFLSEGIKEARVPLTLDLSLNGIRDAGAKFLSEGIKEARVPLTLTLSFNGIGEAGAKFLSEGIKEARVPLTLDLYNKGAGAGFLSEAIEDNFIIEARANPVGFLSRIKLSQSMRILGLSAIPTVLANLVQGYIGDEDLAWIEVAAIRAVEGASRDNKYASIDYDLLTAVYSTAPVAAVASALEGAEMENDGQDGSNSASQSILAEHSLRPNKRKQASDQEAVVEEASEAHPLKEIRTAEPQESSTARGSLRSNKRKTPEDQDEFKGQGTLGYTDNSYPEYYNSGIDQVFELRLARLANAVVLKSQYFGEELGNSVSRLSYDVSSILSDGTVQTVLVPVNLYNKHWLGLLFRNLGTIVEVTYMDPEQGRLLPGLRSGLENGLSFNGYESRLEEARLTPQSYNNCGYEVIENFVYYLTGTRATQEAAIYVHSLLVENSLLDPNVYGLKIEENNKLLGFLSNAEPIAINEITLFAEQRSETKHERAVPDNSITKLKIDLPKASIRFKALDFVVNSARFAQEPSIPSFKKLALGYAYLQAMVSGVNRYSAMIAGAEILYQLQLGEYQKAFNVASTTMSAMALPIILAIANRPYLGLAYGAWMTASTAYGAITNAYSFAMELSDNDATLRSAMAYKDLTVTLASSPLQAVYDFEVKVQEYKLQINDLLFEKEKSTIQTQVKDEFEQKVFDYICLPELIEKYILLNDVIRGELTEGEAQSLKSKPVAISYGALKYDYCVKTEDPREETTEHYYCCNIGEQILNHVVLTGSGRLEILESL
jgi:hypothetical protein